MSLEVEFVCPLGNECETTKEKTIQRCAWYTKMSGQHPSEDRQIDNWACAMSWMPLLQVEVSKTNRSQTKAIESFRNETKKGQDEFNKLAQERNKFLGVKK